MSSSAMLQATIWNDGGTDVNERVVLNRGGLVVGVQLDLLRIHTDLRGQPRSSGPENQSAPVVVPGRLDAGSTTRTLGKPGGWLNTGEGDASSISVASSWSSLGTGDSGVIQGGTNLVWTTCAPFLWAVRDRVFCDGTANEGRHPRHCSLGLCTRELRFAGSETDEACPGCGVNMMSAMN